MPDLSPIVLQEIDALARTLAEQFTPPEFYPGCQIKSVADKDQYATNNGWLEAFVAQHNQQRVRYRGDPPGPGTADFVDVIYFPSRRLFEVYGPGGLAASKAGGYWPGPNEIRIGSVTYSTLAAAAAAAVSGDVVLIGPGTFTFSSPVTFVSGVHDRGSGINSTILSCTTAVNGITINNGSIRDLTISYVTNSASNSTALFLDGDGNAGDPTVENVKITGTNSGSGVIHGIYVNTGDPHLYDTVSVVDGKALEVNNINSNAFLFAGRYEGGSSGDIVVTLGEAILLGPSLGTDIISGNIKGWFFDSDDNVTITASSKLIREDSVLAPLNLTARSSAPTVPSANDIYVDDGTNTGGTPAFRRYTGSDWQTLDGQATIKVKNTSGATANVNDVGYIAFTSGAGPEYKTTTTANDPLAYLSSCVVTTSGANNADIYVQNRGRVKAKYTGTAPSVGSLLFFSTTAGQLTVGSTMRPELAAIAQAAGSSGLVEVLLHPDTKSQPVTPTLEYTKVASASASTFVGTIATLPGGATLTYNITSGNEDTLVPLAAGMLTYLVLYNTTRSNSTGLISSVTTGTNTIVLTAAVPGSWQVGDTITPESPTTGTIAGVIFYDYELKDFATVPALTRAIDYQMIYSDSGGTGNYFLVHPHEAVVASKLTGFQNWSTGTDQNVLYGTVALINRRIAVGWLASGSATANPQVRLKSNLLAAP